MWDNIPRRQHKPSGHKVCIQHGQPGYIYSDEPLVEGGMRPQVESGCFYDIEDAIKAATRRGHFVVPDPTNSVKAQAAEQEVIKQVINTL